MVTGIFLEADAAASALDTSSWTSQLPSRGAAGDDCGADMFGFASEIMRFIHPLEELAEQVAGDPAGLYQASHSWETFAGNIQSVSALIQEASETLVEQVHGAIARATQEVLNLLASAAHSIADWSKVTSQVLQLCVRAVEILRSLVCAAFELLSSTAGLVGDLLFGSWPWEVDEKARAINEFAENCERVIAEAVANVDRALQALREMVRLATDLYRAIVPFHQELEDALGKLIDEHPPGRVLREHNLDLLAEAPSMLRPGVLGDTYNPSLIPYPGSDQRFSQHYDLGYSHEYDLGQTDMTTEQLNQMLKQEFGHIFLPSRVGDNSQLNMQLTGEGQLIKTSLFGLGIPGVTAGDINVRQITDDGFVIAAQKGHPEYPGEVAFRLRNVNGRGVFEVTGAYDETILSRMEFPGNTNPAYAAISDYSIWADMQYRLEDMIKYGR